MATGFQPPYAIQADADYTAVVGAMVNLYRDGGNGIFHSGGDDVFVASKTSDSAGKYRFDTLVAGYYVQQPLQPHPQKPNRR